MGIHLKILANFFIKLLTSYEFIFVTILGNTIVFAFAAAMLYIEGAVNSQFNSFLDALWWAFATATTVGYGDKVPVTATGKILGIVLMIIGTGLFATYVTIMADGILKIKEAIYK
ncbi:MAG: potassium channel family protein [Halobacteriovoraceae bacterium]|nr:potassium channel family protein [Halobacteriovoraceae bacterium]